jgi:integrase
MPQMKLTKSNIDRVAKPGLFASDVLYWDTETKGFGLRVTPTGKTTFIAQGRVNGIGAAVRVTVGPYGVFTPDQAREAAKEHLRSMGLGVDPREVKRQDEAMRVTLRQVADAYFARPGKLKQATRNEMDRHVKSVFGAWENKPIASITEADVRKRHREMCATGLRGVPAPGQAQISLVTLRTLINFANRRFKRGDGTPLIPSNPVSALKDDFVEFKPRTRDIDAKKVGEVYHMLAEARVSARDDDARSGVDLVRFLMLTGARRNEAAQLTWDRVDLDEGWFHLPDPKNRNPVWIPLSTQAVELLKSLPRRKLEDGTESPYVFPSRSKAGHVMDTRAPLERISKVAGLHLSAHDLRRTFVSVGVATLGIDLHKIELLTNHVPKGITAKHYLQTSRLQYLQSEVQAIGDWVEQQAAIAEAKATGGNVVSLPQRA